MKTAITKGLTGEKRQEVEREFRASALIRERLVTLIQEKINAKRTKRVSEDEYSNPNWAYLQADKVGYERAMNEIISLLSTVDV